jgi:hypothetical protein
MIGHETLSMVDRYSHLERDDIRQSQDSLALFYETGKGENR